MKHLLHILSSFILFLFAPLAGAHSCPTYLRENPKAMASMDFLNRFKGSFALGSCRVEIVMCDGWGEAIGNDPIAEVLITDDKGREAYLSIVFPRQETDSLNTKTTVSERRFHYEKRDRFFEETYGRTEAVRFEMRTEYDDKNQLKKMEMGLYSTHFQLNQPNGNDSEWFNCGKS